MFNALKRNRITRNTSNVIRKVEHLNMDFCELLLASNLLGEGVYSIETLSGSESTENFLITPSFFREDIGEECYKDFRYLKNSANDLNCYSIVLSKPSFLPIYTDNITSLLQNLTLLPSGDTEMFVQLLFSKRTDHWKNGMIDQYAAYLDGNDFPSNNRVGRSIQRSFLKILDKASGINPKREEIHEISQKILDEGYRFELRVVIHTENSIVFESELKDILSEYDFFNEMLLIKEKNKKQFLEDYIDRKFTNTSIHQMLSEKELISLITDEKITTETNHPNTIVELQENIKSDVLNTGNPLSNVDLLPIGIKKERKIDNELVSDLPSALKKARAIKESKIDILDVELGATVQRITFKIPKNHVYSDIKNRYEDISSALGTDISIIQGNKPDTVTLLIPCSDREVIYLRELLTNEEFLKFAEENPLPFVCGVGMHNELVMKCLTKAPHLLVVGSTNSGKSVFLNALLITLMLLKSPSELRFFLIDPKKVELGQYEGMTHVENVIKDMNKAIGVLDGLIVEMEKRYDQLAKIGVKNIAAYNRQSKSKMPYIICAIDEYNDLKMQHPKVEERIERLGQKARASGIHLIIATQTPNKDVISNTIKTNLPSRISFKLDNHNEYKTVFGTGIPYRNLLGFGDGVVKYVAQTEEFIRFQAPVITLDEKEEEKTFEDIKKVYKGENIKRVELAEIAEEDDLTKLKRIIAETGESRFAELRKELGKGSNRVKELMDQLVSEKWLEEPESKAKGYRLIADEKMLDQWKN